MLEKAIHIAMEAHRGQMDKSGNPYILHPMRVMLMGKNEKEMICGILHDVIEDSSLSLEMLRNEGIDEQILYVLELLTKRDGEDYACYIERIMTNHFAMQIKLYDIEDNMNRYPALNPTKKDALRYEKYEKYFNIIKEKLAMNYTYILECADKSLYTGWTTDLEHRLNMHNLGKASKYTRSHLPVKLVYYEEFETQEEARKRECAIKALSRKEKMELISSKAQSSTR